ncbi:MAG: glutamate mutase L [Ktedonobacterales bacterium]|nr:glutamate mutase L [Ktedonobacterales bacterium]
MLHPTWLPETPDELALDGALAREALRLATEQGAAYGRSSDLAQIDVLIGTGGFFAHQPTLGMAALLLLDAVQPRGICTLILDSAQLAEPLGAASLLDPMASADAVDVDALLVQLGTCVATVGMPPPGEPALRVVLEYADGREQVAEILPGTIEALPLAPGQTARMQLFPAAGVDIGLGPGEHAQAGNPVEGGRLGLIIDARGRPLTLPENDQQRQARLRQWHAAFGF